MVVDLANGYMGKRSFMTKIVHLADLILNYNPEAPQARFKAAGVKGALMPKASDRLPISVLPWPSGRAPTPAPLPTAPKETEDLSKFRGYDAVVVTWTSAEAAALAALFTPGYTTSGWYEYRHNVAAYIPLVTGTNAPFNSKAADMARFYHSLGLYFPCVIGGARVLVFKSGLHLDYDGPATPVRKLMTEIAQTIQPKVFITTGTGGGIGSQVALGDVVIAGQARFDCTTQFKNETWHDAVYKTAPLPPACLTAITPALTKVNAARISNARPVPKIWASPQDTIVTTDFFGFDDSTDYYKLQGLGQVCDMGDAMVGMALQPFAKTQWFAIRNASDPQIPNPNHNIEEASKQASEIYSRYGALTTAASVIATWAVIDTIINK
jgi:nucleoside phosphorylase